MKVPYCLERGSDARVAQVLQFMLCLLKHAAVVSCNKVIRAASHVMDAEL